MVESKEQLANWRRSLNTNHPSYKTQFRQDLTINSLYTIGGATVTLAGIGWLLYLNTQWDQQVEKYCQSRGFPNCQTDYPQFYQETRDRTPDSFIAPGAPAFYLTPLATIITVIGLSRLSWQFIRRRIKRYRETHYLSR